MFCPSGNPRKDLGRPHESETSPALGSRSRPVNTDNSACASPYTFALILLIGPPPYHYTYALRRPTFLLRSAAPWEGDRLGSLSPSVNTASSVSPKSHTLGVRSPKRGRRATTTTHILYAAAALFVIGCRRQKAPEKIWGFPFSVLFPIKLPTKTTKSRQFKRFLN